jgi:hypothetical protein
MGQTVELEVVGEAINPGDAVTVGTESTEVAPARRRKKLVLGNGSDETIWVKLSEDGAANGEGIPIFTNTGLVLSEYGGAVCAACATGGKSLGRAEF